MARTIVLMVWLVVGVMAQVNVAVSIVPEATFVRKIAGDLAKITVMVPPSASPATYEPRPSQMKAIAKAQVYLAVGVPFERAWLPRFRAQNPRMKMVDITQNIAKKPMRSHGSHAHGGQGGLDPHVWLSPPLVAQMVRNIAKALSKIDPAHHSLFAANLAIFLKEIKALDEKLKKELAPCEGSAMMVFHPSWGYFARTYGLEQIPIEAEGKEPGPKLLAKLIRTAKEKRVKALFVQPQFSKRTARLIAKHIDARLVEADPMAENWAQNLLRLAESICPKR